MRLIFVDTETNDLPRAGSGPRIVSICWMICSESGRLEKMENHLVIPSGFVISPNAMAVHGITFEQARRDGKPLSSVLRRFVDDINSPGPTIIVGHNVTFDLDAIADECRRCDLNVDIETLPFICTMEGSRTFCQIPNRNGKGFKPPRLQELYLHLFGQHFSGAHDAEADVRATARCFFELVDRRVIPDVAIAARRRSPPEHRRKRPETIVFPGKGYSISYLKKQFTEPPEFDFGDGEMESAEPGQSTQIPREGLGHYSSSPADFVDPKPGPEPEQQQPRAVGNSASDQGRVTVVVRCPRCSQRLRAAAFKLLDITCPRCRHMFRKFTG